MGRIQTAYLLCTRITQETTALRVTLSFAREGRVVFQKSRYVFLMISEVPRGFFRFVKHRNFSPRLGQKNTHGPNPLTAPYSAHIL